LAAELPDLHRWAARWFADRGEIVEAVRHMLAAGDRPDAARLVSDHSFRWVLDGEAGKIDAVLQAFPEEASADRPDLALARAASQLNHGRVEEAAAQLALAESHVESAPTARRRRLAVAMAALRLAIARRTGQFSEVIEQVKLLDASISDESSEPLAMGTELRRVALLDLRDRRDMVRATHRCRAAPRTSRRGSTAKVSVIASPTTMASATFGEATHERLVLRLPGQN
jgi:LuxR family maltose regulon positive regulatory protein